MSLFGKGTETSGFQRHLSNVRAPVNPHVPPRKDSTLKALPLLQALLERDAHREAGKAQSTSQPGRRGGRTARSCPARPTCDRSGYCRSGRPCHLSFYPPAGLAVPPRQRTSRLHRLDLHGASPGAKIGLFYTMHPPVKGENPELRDKTDGGVN